MTVIEHQQKAIQSADRMGQDKNTNVVNLAANPSDDNVLIKGDALANEEYIVDPILEAKLVRKIDIRMLPMLWICYM